MFIRIYIIYMHSLFKGHFSDALGVKKGLLWVLGAPWSPKGAPRGLNVGMIPWGTLGSPGAWLGKWPCGASWETLEASLGTLEVLSSWGVPGALPGSFWVAFGSHEAMHI